MSWLSRTPANLVRLNEDLCRNAQTFMKVPNHLHWKLTFPVENFGNTRTAADKRFQIMTGEASAFHKIQYSLNRIGEGNSVLSSNCRGIYPIVFLMGSNKTDKNDPVFIVNRGDQSATISFYSGNNKKFKLGINYFNLWQFGISGTRLEKPYCKNSLFAWILSLTSHRETSRTAGTVIAFHCRNSNIANNHSSFRLQECQRNFPQQAKARMIHCIIAGFLVSHRVSTNKVFQLHSQERSP